MNKHLLPAILSAAVSLSLFSCSEKSQIQESETEITATETTTSETALSQTTTALTTTTSSSVSYMTTAITVTDAKGVPVTDTSGNTVTKIIAADENKKPVTDSKGDYIEVTSVSPSAVTSADITTAAEKHTTTVTVAETTIITTTEAEEQPESEGILKATWTCDGGKSSVNDSGTLMYLNFKIKDNAASGNYDITINSINENPWGAFINYTYLEKLKADFGHGTVSVGGSAEYEDSYGGSEIYADVQNTSGNPGDNISVPVYIMNNPGDIGGFSFAFRYNASVLEYVSVSNGPLLDALASPGSINTSNDLTDQ